MAAEELTVHAFLDWLAEEGVSLHWARAHALTLQEVTELQQRFYARPGVGEECWFLYHEDSGLRDQWGYTSTSKIAAIKAVRALLGIGLKEAKDLVEGSPVHIGKWSKDNPRIAHLRAAGCVLEWR